MKTTVDSFAFREAFRAYDRLDNFSYEGLDALFNYLEDLQREYGDYEGEKWEDMEEAIEWLQDRTTVIPVDDDSVIIAAF